MTTRMIDFEAEITEGKMQPFVYEIESGDYKPMAVGYWDARGDFIEVTEDDSPLFDALYEMACLHAVGGL